MNRSSSRLWWCSRSCSNVFAVSCGNFLYGDSGGRDDPDAGDVTGAQTVVQERVEALHARGGVQGVGALATDLISMVLAGNNAFCAFCVTNATGGGILARRTRVGALRGTGISSGGFFGGLLARTRDGMVMGANACILGVHAPEWLVTFFSTHSNK